MREDMNVVDIQKTTAKGRKNQELFPKFRLQPPNEGQEKQPESNLNKECHDFNCNQSIELQAC